MGSSPPYYIVLFALCARLSLVQAMTGKIVHWNLPKVMFWEKVYLIFPEEKITAAERRVRDLDANLHSLRRIHLHILHNQLTFWFPSHGSFTMYKNEFRMLQNPQPLNPYTQQKWREFFDPSANTVLKQKNARSPSALLW